MKVIFAILAIVFSSTVFAQADSSLEYKVASIDAGKWIEKNDTSVERIRGLLSSAEKIYGLPQEKLADMAARTKDIAKEKQLAVTIAELLDWSLIACDVKCQDKEFAENMTAYVIVRTSSGQTHHQAIHSLAILQNAEKRLSK
ncbi:MAG TPA: hypothetical protein VLB90_06230 [Pseudomonadales bacterium]|nr:hypothetical protein [Pseudomonadales bacterium]